MSARLIVAGLGSCLLAHACRVGSEPAPEHRFEGQVVLRGELVHAAAGAVRIDVWSDPADAFPLLSRRYPLGDPAFAPDGADLVLRFTLDARHAVDRGDERGVPTAVEACFETSGLLRAGLGGDVTARTAVGSGATDIELVLAPRAVLYDGEHLGD